jgi:hypothetical protein
MPAANLPARRDATYQQERHTVNATLAQLTEKLAIYRAIAIILFSQVDIAN